MKGEVHIIISVGDAKYGPVEAFELPYPVNPEQARPFWASQATPPPSGLSVLTEKAAA